MLDLLQRLFDGVVREHKVTHAYRQGDQKKLERIASQFLKGEYWKYMPYKHIAELIFWIDMANGRPLLDEENLPTNPVAFLNLYGIRIEQHLPKP